MKRRAGILSLLSAIAIAALLATSGYVLVTAGAATPSKVEIKALSADPARVTGGDVLVEIAVPEAVADQAVKVTVAGRDVTAAFKSSSMPHHMMGLVTGLVVGKNTIEVNTKGRGAPDATLEVTNFPITGPVFSGPWIQPFMCQTEAFTLPDGSKLGTPTDANCSARTVVQYVYRSTQAATAPTTTDVTTNTTTAAATAQATAGARGARGAQAAGARGQAAGARGQAAGARGAQAADATAGGGQAAAAARDGAGGRGAATPAFKPLPNPASLPSDVAKTTTIDGKTVNFIVRVETGTMDRGIYQSAILFDPTSDPAPTPATPPKGWNRRLIGVHGSGCPGGWYIQGAAMGVSPLDVTRLGEGYALFVNTLNHPTNSCNPVVAGEAAMMGKEHFIETFGVPFYTMSTGGSGGAYTSLQLADAYPGLFDGVTVSATFPDALAIALSGLDAHLLSHYFAVTNTGVSDAKKIAITGFSGVQAFLDAANQAQRTDPVPDRADIQGFQSARWNAAVPADLRYDPAKNPKGARPTVFDNARNIYGRNPTTGAALRPFDNVGVQYGLNALNSGAITVAEFVDLNEKVGGYDQDANYTAARAVGDASAIKRAYQAGVMLSGAGGLSSIPVFDNATSNEAGGYHYGWFHYAVRDRIRQANGGNSDNMVMWRSVNAAAAKKTFDDWMTAFKSDTSNDPQRVKAIRAKPKTGVEGCYDKSTPPAFIAENLVFTSKPTTKCSELYPVYSNVRREAGGPLAANVFKCQLKPIDAHDYSTTLAPADLARLKAVFPGGVCDFTKPGVNQTPVVPWASVGPSQKNLIYDAAKQ